MTKMHSSPCPLLIVRQMDRTNDYPEAMREILETLAEHPGCCDEIWFCTGSMDTIDRIQHAAEQILPFVDFCRKHQMQVSFQQGITLGHAPWGEGELAASVQNMHSFSEEAWVCDETGKRLKGILCPGSPETLDYEFAYASTILNTLHPNAYYLDDDARFSCKPRICFCPRCLAQFQQRIGRKLSREALAKVLFSGSDPDGIREQWSLFHSELLAGYTAQLRRAAEACGASQTRLGLQTVSATDCYDGADFSQPLLALSTPEHALVGIRPGAGYYADDNPRDLLRKAYDVALEAARCSKMDYVGQVCYEAENYPHISMQKTPASLMKECAVMLAAGADALALYWHYPENREPRHSYEAFARYCANHRELFAKMSAIARNSRLAGVAAKVGSAWLGRTLREGEFAFSQALPVMTELSACGIPVTVLPGGAAEVLLLNGEMAQALTLSEWEALQSQRLLLDVEALRVLQARFGGILNAITVSKLPENAMEFFGSAVAQGAQCVLHIADELAGKLPKISRIAPRGEAGGADYGWGSTILSTPAGGKIAITQRFCRFPTAYRRKSYLELLDLLTDGAFPVRLETPLAMDCKVRVNDAGEVIEILLLNLSIGMTDSPLELSVRKPHGTQLRYQSLTGARPDALRDMPYQKSEHDGLETWDFTLEAFAPYQVGILFFE